MRFGRSQGQLERLRHEPAMPAIRTRVHIAGHRPWNFPAQRLTNAWTTGLVRPPPLTETMNHDRGVHMTRRTAAVAARATSQVSESLRPAGGGGC